MAALLVGGWPYARPGIDRPVIIHVCAKCGRDLPAHRVTYCARCQPSRVSNGRGSGAAIRDYRKRALTRDGHRCRVLLDDGSRCPVTEHLEVHHLNSDPSDHRLINLVSCCRDHHVYLERQKRHPAKTRR